MIGYHDDILPAAAELRESPGFPEHPHRGFETVTITIDAWVDHADSVGGRGRYGNGDVQWMCAGRGLSHSEMAGLTREHDKNGGALFQLWLNLPSKSKHCAPKTVMLWNEDFTVEDKGARMTRIAGPGAPRAPPPSSWAADSENHCQILLVDLPPGTSYAIPRLSSSSTLAAYPFQGAVDANDLVVPERHTVKFPGDAVLTNPNREKTAKLLILEAEAIGEPVFHRGPFVASSQQDLANAFKDYQRGAFPKWPWPSDGPGHGSCPRFYEDPASGIHEIRGDPITFYQPGPPSYLPDLLNRIYRRS